MSQKQRSGDVRVTSALPLKADIHRKDRHVSKVPALDIVVPSVEGRDPTQVGRY